jgi:hypothetical protein
MRGFFSTLTFWTALHALPLIAFAGHHHPEASALSI